MPFANLTDNDLISELNFDVSETANNQIKTLLQKLNDNLNRNNISIS
jgi:hypothetical protein